MIPSVVASEVTGAVHDVSMPHAPQRRQRAAYLPLQRLLLPVLGTQKGLQGRADGVGAGTRHREEDEPVSVRDDHRRPLTVTGVE